MTGTAGTLKIKRAALKIGSGKTPGGGAASYVADGVTFIRSQNVHFDGLHLDDVVFVDAEVDAGMASTRVKPDDVLLNITGASLGRTTIVPATLGKANVNQHVCIIRPSSKVVPRYLMWCLQSHPIQERIVELQVGGNRGGLNFDQVGEFSIPEVPLSIQRAVADFLDRETARIDALVAAKRQMVALVKERFWASVTVQLISSAPTFLPLRRFIRGISDGPFGSSLTSSHYSDAGARVVRLGNLGLAEFRHGNCAYIPRDYFLTLHRHRVREGDLLIAGLGDNNNHVGRGCVAPDLGPAIVKADCYCAQIDATRASPSFLALYLSSPLGAMNVARVARGTTRSRINLDIAKEIPVPSISIESQNEIVAEALKGRQRSATLSARLCSQINLLQERRQALITAAVTGPMDTRRRREFDH